jgi:predicted metal-binding protein
MNGIGLNKNKKTGENFKTLVLTAIRLGASDAGIISSADISVENDLANLCKGNPQCENYGLAPSCPPHVAGPSVFRQWRKKSQYSIVVRMDVPSAAMFSDERREIMQV